MARKQIERQVDAVLEQVHGHVLPEVGELQGGAGGVGEALPLGVGIAAEIEHQPPHRVGGVAAVVEDVVPVAVAGHGLVLHEGADQVGEGLLAGCRSGARWRPGRRRRDARLRPAYMASSSPRHHSSRRRLSAAIADFVAQVVGPAAVGVDVVEILVQALGQQEADHVEVLVMVGGQPARVGCGLRRANSVRASASGDRTNSTGGRGSCGRRQGCH